MSAHPDQTSLNGKGQHKDKSFIEDFGEYATALASDLSQTDTSSQLQPAGVDVVDFPAWLETLRVLPTAEIEEDQACLMIERDGISYVIGTLGNISTWTGKAKAKKTTVVSFAIAAAVASLLILNRINGILPVGKQTVLLFDTEQSRHHVLRVIKRICRLCGIENPPNLIVYSLRSCTPPDRLKVVDFALNNTPDLGLVVIDGVRDLAVDPVLDSEQASNIMTHLLQWTDRLKIHIMCILHLNKSDSNLRGHLGTELVNKSETVISITRDPNDKDVSIVTPEYCRDKEFEPFGFSIGEDGMPFLIDDVAAGNTTGLRARKPTVDTMKPEDVCAIVRRAFLGDEQLRYTQLRTNTIEASEFVGVSLAKSRAEEFIRRVETLGYLVKFRPPSGRYDVYKINSEKLPV